MHLTGKQLVVTTRPTLWSAPVIWSWLFALAILVIGVLGMLDITVELHGLPMNWPFQKPGCYLLTALGLFGLAITPLKVHRLHVLFALFNLGFWSNLAYTFMLQLRIGTVVYTIICMGGSFWFLFRTIADYKIRVAVLSDSLRKRITD